MTNQQSRRRRFSSRNKHFIKLGQAGVGEITIQDHADVIGNIPK